ncbi:hypothetical protein E2542_SST11711 [Spatholobus suberectus]|nr:hypothetical protein E2542_SST11700 [Spatholobus suberectus]TKY61858.1 hypothetical protein E2542_SST11711 [Spatholobus suberectus]
MADPAGIRFRVYCWCERGVAVTVPGAVDCDWLAAAAEWLIGLQCGDDYQE